MSKLAKTEGEVRVSDGRSIYNEFYEEEFILSDEVKTLEEARCVIQAGLISERLRKNLRGFKSVRTCEVIDFTNSKEKTETSELDALTIKAVNLGCVPENIENYKRPDYKVKALKKAIEKAEKRIEKANSKESKKHGELDG